MNSSRFALFWPQPTTNYSHMNLLNLQFLLICNSAIYLANPLLGISLIHETCFTFTAVGGGTCDAGRDAWDKSNIQWCNLAKHESFPWNAIVQGIWAFSSKNQKSYKCRNLLMFELQPMGSKDIHCYSGITSHFDVTLKENSCSTIQLLAGQETFYHLM